jgi:hypothetical protein
MVRNDLEVQDTLRVDRDGLKEIVGDGEEREFSGCLYYYEVDPEKPIRVFVESLPSGCCGALGNEVVLGMSRGVGFIKGYGIECCTIQYSNGTMSIKLTDPLPKGEKIHVNYSIKEQYLDRQESSPPEVEEEVEDGCCENKKLRITQYPGKEYPWEVRCISCGWTENLKSEDYFADDEDVEEDEDEDVEEEEEEKEFILENELMDTARYGSTESSRTIACVGS